MTASIKYLLPVHNKVISVFHSSDINVSNIRTSLWLSVAQCKPYLPSSYLGQIFSLLRFSAHHYKLLRHHQRGKLVLWQVITWCIDQCSRLSAVHLAESHGGCDVLGLEAFNEESFHDITAITKPQIKTHLREGAFQNNTAINLEDALKGEETPRSILGEKW